MANLIFGPTGRVLVDVGRYLSSFLSDPAETGTAYLDYVPTSPPDELVPEDIAVSTLMNSQVGARAFLSIQDRGHEISGQLEALPKDVALEDSTPDLRAAVVALVSAVGQWNGIKVSVATKLLHKKRSALIPILDNQAIFGALLWPRWDPPAVKANGDSIDGANVSKISAALEAIYDDLVRLENQVAFADLARLALERHGRSPSRIEIFDMVWWAYFREVQPYVRGRTSAESASA